MLKKLILLLFIAITTSLTAQTSACDVPLRLNQIQVLGSHNSYRKATDKGVMRFLRLVDKIKPGLDIPSLDYSHLPMEMQFDSFAIRSVEIDIYNDPQGGNFYKRYGNRFALKTVNSKEEKLKKPGMKVLHIPDIDYNTYFLTFKDALVALKKWGDAHPKHIPMFILIETKGEAIGDHTNLIKFTKTIPWDTVACDSIDAEIDAVFGKNSPYVLTPDEVRGEHATLNNAVSTTGWPLLNDALGQFVFIMEGGAENIYIKGSHAGLKNRNMFVYAEPDKSECAFMIRNNSRGSKADIKKLVAQGYMIRTRADSGTEEARDCDYRSCTAAFNSGAQIISTDYYRADPRSTKSKKWSNYCVTMPNHSPARINPLLNIPCRGAALVE